MNRFTTFTAVALLTLVPATSALGQTSLIVSGGLNLASVTTSDDEVDPESVNRLALGLTAAVPVSEWVELSLGAVYSQRGFGVFLSEAGLGEFDLALKVDYLEFVTQVGTSFSLGESASLHLMAGPALALKLSCSVSGSFLGEEVDQGCDEEDEDLKGMDLGVVGGPRLEIGVSERMGISMGAFYNLGLLHIFDSDEDLSVKNRVLTLQAGVVYSIG